MSIPARLAGWIPSLGGPRRGRIMATAVTLIVLGIVGVGCGGSGSGKASVATTTTESPITEPSTTEPPTTEAPITEVPTTEPDTTVPSPSAVSGAALMSMIGRPLTSAEVGALSKMCYRSFEFGQDIHCEATAGFGLSLDNGAVREVYLYNYAPPDQESFPGELPGGVTWDSTLSDITGALGQPECVSSIIGFDANYTIDGYDVEYTVEASHEPTARLQKITVRPLADRPSSCHVPTWSVGT